MFSCFTFGVCPVSLDRTSSDDGDPTCQPSSVLLNAVFAAKKHSAFVISVSLGFNISSIA